jgi:hypothetical protein
MRRSGHGPVAWQNRRLAGLGGDLLRRELFGLCLGWHGGWLQEQHPGAGGVSESGPHGCPQNL